LSEINWRPLDDFYRLKPDGDAFVFEGNYNRSEHFPGARSGGARASYLSDRGIGWGLVSADGWRVPYRGSDCVIYHEGCGHTVGLPHPEPQDGSVMSLGQYRGWLSESWLDKSQKERLGWNAEEETTDPQIELFSRFRALPRPPVPQPGQAVFLELNWPHGAKVKSLRVRFQTSVEGPWIEWPQSWDGDLPQVAELPTLDRATPVSYRVDAELENGAKAELWGYFQVRATPNKCPQPLSLSPDLIKPFTSGGVLMGGDLLAAEKIDLLALADPEQCWTVGPWSREEGKLLSPKRFGARLQVPYSPPEQYRLVLVVEPLDEPDGLILGQVLGGRRFVTLFNYTPREKALSAIEDVDGRNVGNSTTFTGDVLRKDVLSQVIVTVKKRGVTMSVDGRAIVAWEGRPDRLSLSDYWNTPNASALILGTYDCRYRFHRITMEPISGQGRLLTKE
jgi:hypothetical protein